MSKNPVGKNTKSSKSKSPKTKTKKPNSMTKASRSAKGSGAIHRKPVVSRETSQTRKNILPLSSLTKKIITLGIIISAAVVLLCVVVNVYYEPGKVADRKLAELARDYYENYYYDKFVSSLGDYSLEDAIAEQNGTGFSAVPLRHLLLFDNQRDRSYERYFDNTRYFCDRSLTTIKIFPDPPYGRTDYHVEYTKSSCIYR